ncbi:MAG TPA: GH3 auxin-responsive promoter family protein [Candidatus Limnocylindrales bacterium]|nr:GH3 auxin-responsive promoter family protein [Candidatus Limnocylindrales bacterium]
MTNVAEPSRAYAVVITSSAGLWSYLLGDTVRFTARDPLRLTVTGRTRHVIDVFGEHVTVEEVERALTRACRRTEAEVVEFTVAPRHPSTESARGGHDWLVEFWVPPDEPEEFARLLDEQLSALNTGYRSRRWRDIRMAPPRVVALPRGSFHAWMRRAGTLGDQQKVPRVTGSREIAEELLAAAVALGGAEVLAAGARVGYGAGATIEALTGELAPEAPVSS